MVTFNGSTLPRLSGTTALVTGTNSGIGYETALALAGAGVAVYLAGRDITKLEAARARITEQFPDSRAMTLRVDLADLDSIKEAAHLVLNTGKPLDLLINNAGVMAIPRRGVTKDGFELTFGTNHLGHFALTGQLLPALLMAKQARVVQLSAMVARNKGITFEDPQSESHYSAMGAYARSKLANVLFVQELARRASATSLIAVAAHPGTAMTALQRHAPRVVQALARLLLERFIGQSVEQAALPSLYAATQNDVQSGDFIGPTGRWEARGAPGHVSLPPASTDTALAARLWNYSEEVTKVHYCFPQDPSTSPSPPSPNPSIAMEP